MKLPIPAAGLQSPDAIRVAEASSTEFSQVMELVRLALAAKIGVDRWGVYAVAMYPDRVVAMRDARHYAYPYTIGADNVVTIGEPTEVVQSFDPVRMAEANGTPGDSAFLEAKDDEGLQWEVVLIRGGASKNANYYTDAVLREAAPMFEGIKVFAKSDRDHIAGEAKDVRNIVGWISSPTFVEGTAGSDTGEVRGTLHLVESAPVRGPLVDAWKRGKKDLMGLSIDADAKARKRTAGGKTFREATQFTRIRSVDVIVEPSAGGAFVRLIEATQETDPMRARLIAKIKQAPKTAAKIADIEALTDDELEQRYTEAVAELTPPTNAVRMAEAVTAEDLRMVEARFGARTTIAASNLPQAAKDRVQATLDARERFTEADVTAAIDSERAYLGKFVEAGHVALPDFGSGARTEDRKKTIDKMWDDFFGGAKGALSLREAYVETTGDRRVTGRISDCDRTRLAEAVGDASISIREAIDMTALADVLGAAMQRRMIQDYAGLIQYDAWRSIVNTMPVSDFRTNEITRMGGYGNLPAVAAAGPYNALSSPADEKATYAVSKRGGTETVTLEVIRNDDVRVVREIPRRMAYAAKRTLYEFVFDLVRTNPTLYDSVAFFHATHANLGSAALDATSWSAARLAMMKQTEADSSKRLGIPPRILLCPPDLEEAANNLFVRNTNNDPTFVQNQRVQIISVAYWTDVTDWAAFADPRELPCIEIGFLDGNEEPEMFVQDMPNVGSLFSNDQHTYKIRHIYNGVVHNYRGGYKAVVAG